MAHKVLISDKLAPEGVAILEQESELRVDVRPGLPPDEPAYLEGLRRLAGQR